MADLKITNALVNDIAALQRAAATVYTKKSDAISQTADNRADQTVSVDIDPDIASLAKASPPSQQVQENPPITEQEAKQLAYDIGHDLKGIELSFASRSEKVVLSLFG